MNINGSRLSVKYSHFGVFSGLLQEISLLCLLDLAIALEYKYGFVRKTMCLYSIITTAASEAMFFALSILGTINIARAIGYIIIVRTLSPIFLHRQVGKALKEALRRIRGVVSVVTSHI